MSKGEYLDSQLEKDVRIAVGLQAHLDPPDLTHRLGKRLAAERVKVRLAWTLSSLIISETVFATGARTETVVTSKDDGSVELERHELDVSDHTAPKLLESSKVTDPDERQAIMEELLWPVSGVLGELAVKDREIAPAA